MSDTFLAVVASNAVVAAVLAVGIAALGRWVRHPALLHALWLLVLLKLVTPLVWRVPLPWPEVRPAANPMPLVEIERSMAWAEPLVLEVSAENPGEPLRPTPTLKVPFEGQAVVLACWGMGTLSCWVLALRRLRRFRRLVRLATLAPEGVQRRTRELAARLGLQQAPPVLLLPAVVPPMLWATGLSPKLLVPATLWERLTPAQRDTLLAHELAHLRRGDVWVRWLELVVLSLHWWNPVAWWACRALAEAEEQCCDAWVVWVLPEQAEEYAATLVVAVSFLAGQRHPLPAGASGIGAISHLKRRIHMIVRETTPRTLTWRGLAVISLLGALLLAVTPLWGVPSPETEAALAFGTGTQDPAAAPAEAERVDTPRGAHPGKQPITKESVIHHLNKLLQGNWEADNSENQHAARNHLVDALDLLNSQKKARLAERDAAAALMHVAEARAKRIQALAERGAVSLEEQERFQAEVAQLRARVVLAEVAVQEAEVRVRQAQRELDDLSRRPLLRTASATALFPSRNLDVGSVKGKVGASVSLRNRTKDTYRISGVRVNNSAITATPNSVELTAGDEGTISIWVDGARFTGSKTFTLWVHFSHPREEQVSLEVKARSSLTGGTTSPPADRTPSPPPGSVKSEVRLQELEQRLDKLLKEAQELQQELRPKKSEAPATRNQLQEMVVHTRDFFVPFQFSWTGREITHLTLWLTRDNGQTWEKVGTEPRSAGAFTVRGLPNGTYGFAVSETNTEGKESAGPRAGEVPHLQVRVAAEG